MLPAWERVDPSARAAFNKLFEAFPAEEQCFEQAGEFIAVVAGKPGCGDFPKDAIHNFFREIVNAFDPGCEVGESANAFVDDGAKEKSEQGGVAELPVGSIEKIAVVHHLGDEADLERIAGGLRTPVGESSAEEDGLAGIGIAGPFVEGEDAEEIFRVGDLFHESVGEDIVDGLRDGIARETGAKVPAGGDFAAGGAELYVDFGELTEEAGGDFDDAGFRLGDIEMGEENGGDTFIDEDAAMLRIVGEFDDVVVTIGGFHQEGLRAATHAAQRSTGENGHLSLV